MDFQKVFRLAEEDNSKRNLALDDLRLTKSNSEEEEEDYNKKDKEKEEKKQQKEKDKEENKKQKENDKEDKNKNNKDDYIPPTTCKIDNCRLCEMVKEKKDKDKEYTKITYQCLKCQTDFKLEDHKCYSRECSAFGECKLCTAFSCYKCHSNYNLQHGVCEPGEFLVNLEIASAIIVPLFIVFVLILLIIISKKQKKQLVQRKTYSAKMINKKRIVSGQYIIMGENYKDQRKIPSDESIERVQMSKSNMTLNGENKTESKCVICKNKNIFSFSECGCCLCKIHSNEVRKPNSNIICPIHEVKLTGGFTIKKSKIKKMDIKTSSDYDAEGIEVCQFCNIYPGTRDYSNGYTLLICEKCYLKLFSN
ncbi:MAG: hypothetical protein MJ252_15480 [archaeon]|nr:hypothetical protein [archaeon]